MVGFFGFCHGIREKVFDIQIWKIKPLYYNKYYYKFN